MTSITAERNSLSQVGGTLRRREQWGARNSYTSGRTVVEPADHQFVHITVSNPRSYASNDAHARAIEAIGRARFPATGISYNRLIMPDGAAYEAQPVGRRGAHTVNNKGRSTCNTPGCPSRGGRIDDSAGNLNRNARAYVICQNVNDPVSRAQVESMARVMAADILAGFVKHGAPIHGHRCVAWKSCPADPMWAQMGELERLRDQYVRDGLTKEDDDMPLNADDKAWIRYTMRQVMDEKREGYATRAAAWAAQKVWMVDLVSPENGKTYRTWQYLTSTYARVGWPNLRKGIEGIVRREGLAKSFKSFTDRTQSTVSATLYRMAAQVEGLADKGLSSQELTALSDDVDAEAVEDVDADTVEMDDNASALVVEDSETSAVDAADVPTDED